MSQKRPKKLLERVRDAIRLTPCSLSTEKTCVSCIKHYLLFHGNRHPLD